MWFGEKHVLQDINLDILKNQVTAIIGPSGCGKTTLIRSMNKMHELIPNAKVTGNISMDSLNIYGNNSKKGLLSSKDLFYLIYHFYLSTGNSERFATEKKK